MAGRQLDDPFFGSPNYPNDPEVLKQRIESHNRKLWTHFQNTATSLTHLYKCKAKADPMAMSTVDERSGREADESWIAFQSAAASLTSLYKDSVELLGYVSDLAKANDRRKVADFSSKWASATVTSGSCAASAAQIGFGMGATPFANVAPQNASFVNTGAPAQLFASAGPQQEQLSAGNNETTTPNGNNGSSRLKRSWSPSMLFDLDWKDNEAKQDNDEDDMDGYPLAKRKRNH